jgi:hypothetical protein
MWPAAHSEAATFNSTIPASRVGGQGGAEDRRRPDPWFSVPHGCQTTSRRCLTFGFAPKAQHCGHGCVTNPQPTAPTLVEGTNKYVLLAPALRGKKAKCFPSQQAAVGALSSWPDLFAQAGLRSCAWLPSRRPTRNRMGRVATARARTRTRATARGGQPHRSSTVCSYSALGCSDWVVTRSRASGRKDAHSGPLSRLPRRTSCVSSTNIEIGSSWT